MKQRVTIKDIAEELGLSSATVSNVIHGKTRKISAKTVSKVQEKLEESGYIPNMAAVLLAQNSSKIVCVVLSDDVKYEGRMIEDPFVSGMLNTIAKGLDQNGYFMMLKEEKNVDRIVQYASMWNMAGLILIGYCDVDYENLRSQMHIPFVVVDAYTNKVHQYSDVGVDNIRGGYLAGKYLIEMGHRRMMFLADNDEDCDHDRYVGMCQALEEARQCGQIPFDTSCADFHRISDKKQERRKDYERLRGQIPAYTAAFCASDVYAVEFMNVLQQSGVVIPRDFSLMGFDDIPLASFVYPGLTTVSQNLPLRAKEAVRLLMEMIQGDGAGKSCLVPVELVERDSVARRKEEH